MHELGVVFNVIRRVEEVAAENDVTSVLSVSLRIGEVSTVIPEMLVDCWNWAVKRTEVLKEAKLEVERIPAVTFCEDCKQTYPTIPNGKICPHCGSAHTFLVQGNEFEIRDIVVADTEPGNENAGMDLPDVADAPAEAMADPPDMSVVTGGAEPDEETDDVEDGLPEMDEIPEEPLDDIPDIPDED